MIIATTKEINAMRSLIKRKGYKWFDRPFELNIIGIRRDSTISNKFNDSMFVIYKDDKNVMHGKIYPITTDTGTYFINKPLSNMGAAILMEGQYVDAYQVGIHHGQYEALVQRGTLNILRNYNRVNYIDILNGKKESGKGFGINIHRAAATGTTINVDNWSAGCQVFANSADFADFMLMANKQKSLYGNNFTYTLIDQRAYTRMIIRRTIYTGLLIGAIVYGVFYYRSKILKTAHIEIT